MEIESAANTDYSEEEEYADITQPGITVWALAECVFHRSTDR